MILIQDPKNAPTGHKVIAVGSFDGVHLGHQALLARARRRAQEAGLPLLVYTFDPPTKALTKGVPILSTLSEKAKLLEVAGADVVLAVPFDEAFARRTKEAFLEELRGLEPRLLVVGEDFRFGRGRSGGLEDLAQVAPVEAVPLVCHQGAPVKSTRIRDALLSGDVELAQALLGRPYAVEGVVVRGQGLGRQLGFPTANLALPAMKALPQGVFAVEVEHKGRLRAGVAHAGPRPTLEDARTRLEVHLFEGDGELYGETLRVRFLKRLRAPRRFPDLAALKAQIARDVEAARAFFSQQDA